MQQDFVSDQKGTSSDLKGLTKEKWLLNARVCHFISQRKGRFWVNITFYNPRYPFQLKVQTIDHYPRRKTAEQFAEIFQRGIQKDSRGTLKLNDHAFNICAN